MSASSVGKPSEAWLPLPSLLRRSFSAMMPSASASLPAIAFTSSPEALPTASAMAAKAFSQVARVRLPFWVFTIGALRRWRLRPSYWNRALSEIHSSLTSSLRRGVTRITSVPLESTRMLQPKASETSTDSVSFSSHGRAVKAYGLEVSAPTGQRSIILADILLVNSLLTYVPTSVSRPRPVVPRSSTPATSLAKRTQRVQWMQRVMTVLTKGPSSLSSTLRFSSVKRPRSLP
mmetsp:Transcript_14486/g.24550  ORF Transcript_14486/g.24550 Transcript_14486/m.24550 type:complete len:233 (+) Transcript_14486:1671-2369(+)